jgi:hypothetical protein
MNDRRKKSQIRGALDDPEQRRDMIIRMIIATQALEGIDTTWEQATEAYDRVMAELRTDGSLIGNPGDATEAARKTFSRFHSKKPDRGIYPFHKNENSVIDLDDVKWPESLCLLGDAMRTLYESDKWQKPGKTTQYYHDHDPNIVKFIVPSSHSKKHGGLDHVELSYEWPREVILIGTCIGFVTKLESTGLITEGVMKGKNLLVCSPDGWVDPSRPSRVFLAIINLSGGGVEGIIDGGNLRITSHGVEG